MAGYIQELENNQAILLMYLAGELPDEERAEVDQMLAADASLGAQLSELAAAQAAIDRAIGDFDAQTRLPTPEAVAVSRASRAIRQWATRRLVTPPVAVRKKSLRLPPWVYASSAAAVLLLGVGIALHMRSDGVVPRDEPGDPQQAIAELDPNQSQALLDEFAGGRASDSAASDMTASDSNAAATQPDTTANLDAVDRSLASMQTGGDEFDNIILDSGAGDGRRQVQ